MSVPPELGLQSTDVVKAVEFLEYRQLDYWCRNGAITPSIRAADGAGAPGRRLWSHRDVAVLGAIAQVRADLLNLGCAAELTLIATLWTRLHDNANTVLHAGTVNISVGLFADPACDHPRAQYVYAADQPVRCGRCGGLAT